MTYRKVDASRGVEWLKQSVQLLLRNPAPFALMGLVIAVIGLVPVLGGLAMLILGPALYAGFMVAARSQERSGNAEFTQLFAAFQEEGKLPKMLVLCLPAIVGMLVLAILAAILFAGVLMGGGLSGATGSEAFALAALGGGGIVFVVLALAVAFLIHALLFFAIPRVMFDGVEPFPAMKESWHAVLANIGAVLLFLVLVLVAYVLIAMLLGNASTLLMQLVMGVVVVPVVAVAVYRGYADVFGSGTSVITGEVPAAAPPAAPPATPPPAAPPPTTPPSDAGPPPA